MPNTQRFIDFEKRLNELRENLLPANFSATGEYSDKEIDHARGYRLLAHAEIESYLEDISKDTIQKAISEWKRNKKPCLTMISFIAAYHSSWLPNNDLNDAEILEIAKSRRNYQSIEKVIENASRQFLQKIKDNHGIKENNFYTLISPTGIDTESIDPDLIPNLNSYGSLRGEVAHSTRSTTRTINPQDEINQINCILNGLKDLDNKIKNIEI